MQSAISVELKITGSLIARWCHLNISAVIAAKRVSTCMAQKGMEVHMRMVNSLTSSLYAKNPQCFAKEHATLVVSQINKESVTYVAPWDVDHTMMSVLEHITVKCVTHPTISMVKTVRVVVWPVMAICINCAVKREHAIVEVEK